MGSAVMVETLEERRLLTALLWVSSCVPSAGEGGTLAVVVTGYDSDVADYSFPPGGGFPVHPALTVNYTLGGSATPGLDYEEAASGSFTIPGWAINQQPFSGGFTIHLKRDNLVEEPETVVATITAGSGYTVGFPPYDMDPGNPSTVAMQISDDPPIVNVSLKSNGSEDPPPSGSPDTTPVCFTVSRTGGDITQPLTVSYNLAGSGDHPASSADYTNPGGSVTIPAGASSADVSVTVTDDDAIEAAREELSLTLTGGGIGTSYVFPGYSPTTNPNPPAPVATGTIADNDFRVIAAQIGFNSQGITRDAGGAYGGTQWIDNDGNPGSIASGDVAYPLSFWRSTPDQNRFVSAGVKFWIEGNPTAPKYKLIGTGTGPGGGTFEAETTLGSEGGKPVLIWSTTSSNPLPTTIKKGNLEIDWKVLRSNIPAKPIAYGKSKDVAYVTGAEARDAYETVIDLGCTGADGIAPGGSEDANGNGVLDAGEDANGNGVLDDDKAVVNGIWGKFSGNSTKRVDGTTMTYWGPLASARPDVDEYQSVGELVKYHDGRCQAWAQLLMGVFAAQGVTATGVEAAPGIASVYSVSLGKTYKIIPPGGPIASTSGLLIQSGLAGQGNPTPPTLFNAHALVALGSTLYDPSYGTAFHGTSLEDAELQWTVASVQGFIYQNPADPNDTLPLSLGQLGIIGAVAFT